MQKLLVLVVLLGVAAAASRIKRGAGGCTVNGKKYKIDEAFRQKNFRLKCTAKKLEVTGCYYQDEDGSYKELSPGQDATVGTKKYICKLRKSGIPRFFIENTVCQSGNKTYEKGQIWVEKRYKVKCNERGFRTILACITTDGKEIQIGEKKVSKDGRVAHCQQIGGAVYYDEYQYTSGKTRTTADKTAKGEPAGIKAKDSCIDEQGRKKVDGDRWKSGNYVFICESGGKELAGCITEHGHEIPVNQGLILNGIDYSCLTVDGQVKYSEKRVGPSNDKCHRKGKSYDVGATWVEPKGHFRFRCKPDLSIDVTECLTLDGQEIKLGESIVSGGLIHNCFEVGKKVFYKTVLPDKGKDS